MTRCCFVLALASAVLGANWASGADASPVTVTGCVLRIRDQAEVPAGDRGILQAMTVDVGETVAKNQVIAELDHREADLREAIAAKDWEIASRREQDSVAVALAGASREETARRLEAAEAERSVATKRAASDLQVRLAKKEREIAEEELTRNLAAREQFRSSVAAFRINQLRNTRDRHALQTQLAEHDQSIQQAQRPVFDAQVSELRESVRRAELEQADAQASQAIARLETENARHAHDLATELRRRREVRSPLAGLIVERFRQPGEWVEPGQRVYRVLSLDVLVVEGYAQAADLSQTDVGREVELIVLPDDDAETTSETTTGTLRFVSPEIDPVSGEVLIRVEVENSDHSLRPGLRANVTIPPRA